MPPFIFIWRKYMPMNPKVKKQWCTELRAPEAIQGHDVLRNEDNGQCCLDFLNQMCSDAGYQSQPTQLAGGHWGYSDVGANPASLEDGYQVAVLTEATMLYAGLNYSDPEVTYKNGKYHLSYLNDIKGLTLPEIATVIEDDDEL